MFLYYSSLFQWKNQLVILPVFWQYLYYDLSLCMTRRNSPRWGSCGLGGCQARRWMGWFPFVGQAIEFVTEKRVAIPCENLASSQIRKDCWIEKLSKFLGESVRSRNCNSFFCYGFLAKDTGYRPAYPTPLRRTPPNYQLTNLNSHL